MPRSAVAMSHRILSDELAEQLVAAVGQRPSRGIERPFKQPAELIGVVDVAVELVRLQRRDRAHRKAPIVDAEAVCVMLKRPSDRKQCASSERDRYAARKLT